MVVMVEICFFQERKIIVNQITRDTLEIIIRENFRDDQFKPKNLRFQNVGVLYFGANIPKKTCELLG